MTSPMTPVSGASTTAALPFIVVVSVAADTLTYLAAFILFVPAWLAAGKTFALREGHLLGARGEFGRSLLVTTAILVPSLAGFFWTAGAVARYFLP